LYERGKRLEENCKKAPLTCKLIDKIEPVRSCSRGQVKFLAVSNQAHVWPHCGPTNCRLRAQMGLVIPELNSLEKGFLEIRVGNETKRLQEGKFEIMDDS
jgi:aspartate beta-hydroxylase